MTSNSTTSHRHPDNQSDSKENSIETGPALHLAAMGQLAAGIAHEINTPAQYVSDNIHFLQDAFDGFLKLLEQYQVLHRAVQAGSVTPAILDTLAAILEDEDVEYLLEQVPEAVQQSLEGMTRITQIVEAMRDFSHPGLMEKKTVDINKAIRNTVMVSRNLWKYSSDLETDLDEALPSVPCQPGEINQVLLNLISNAADAIAEAQADATGMNKGIIRISTRKVDEWVEFQVSDTGTGIPAPIQEKIFDPFYTTKPVGKGTGQGLAIAASVIAQHGGTIKFITTPNEGTTFLVRLPLGDPDTE